MKTTEKIICPLCSQGQLIPQIGDYQARLPDGERVVVSGVEMEICDKCGETTISLESSRKVEAFVAAQIEQLSKDELVKIRERLGLDQSEISEILGLGGKTYHRWEKGYQIPSRSMGYYLRVLNEFPEAFLWLRNREWRKPTNVVYVDFLKAFPALTQTEAAPQMGPPQINPARALFGRAAR